MMKLFKDSMVSDYIHPIRFGCDPGTLISECIAAALMYSALHHTEIELEHCYGVLKINIDSSLASVMKEWEKQKDEYKLKAI